MKKLIAPLAVILFTLIISCNSSNDKKYTLKPNMKTGESYTLAYKIDIDQDVMGMNNKMLMSMSYQIKIKNITAQQDMELDFMYDRMLISMKSPMFNMSYDSDSTYLPAEPGEEENVSATGKMMQNLYANSMGRMINKPVQVTLASSGEVKEVKGYRELVNAIKDSINSAPGGNAEALNDMMSEDQIRQVFQQTFGTFPKKPVGIGEAWTNEINMTQSGMVMKYTNTYKITEILEKENEAIIDVKGIISMGMSGGKATAKMDASGNLTGNLVVDLNSGLVKTGKQNLDIKMEMEVMEKKVPMTMKGTITLTGKKL